MSWLKLDTSLPNHPKVRKLGTLLGKYGNGLAAIVGLWCWADHYAPDGNLSLHDPIDIAMACGVDAKRVDILDALARSGFVDRGDDGSLSLHEWEEHQGSIYRTRARNAEKAARWRMRRTASRDDDATAHGSQRDGNVTGQEERRGEEKRRETPSPPPPSSPAKPARRALTPETDPDFEAFWATYPRKANKPDARKAWQQTATKRPAPQQLLAAVREQASSSQWTRDGGSFIPYPATWLRAESWADELPTPLAPVMPFTRPVTPEAARVQEYRKRAADFLLGPLAERKLSEDAFDEAVYTAGLVMTEADVDAIVRTALVAGAGEGSVAS